MNFMFNRASSFNQDLSNWDVSLVTNMLNMFSSATAFNGDITTWETDLVTNMRSMFNAATSFNQDIGGWETGSVNTMVGMLKEAPNFNHDLSAWDTSSITTMNQTFFGAFAFDQSVAAWDVSLVSDMTDMFAGVKLSTQNYDDTLIGWNTQTLQSGVTLNGGNSTYCNAAAARANMIGSDTWSITDAGLDCGGVNQAPTDLQIDGANTDTINENSTTNSIIGALTTTDSNGADTHTYTLGCTVAGADDTDFNISGTNLRNTTVFDFENPTDADTDGTYEVCIRTTDSAAPNLFYEETITIAVNDIVETDTDGDGNPDTIEDAGANGGDGNSDGIPDSLQQSVSGAANPATSSYATLVATGACTFITQNAFVTESSLSAQDPSADYPVGLVDFQVECPSPGDSATVTLYYDQDYDTTGWTYKKYDGTGNVYSDITNIVTFVPFTYTSGPETGNTVTSVTFTVTDGDPQTDEDGVADRFINDPSGPATPVIIASTSSSRSGGSVKRICGDPLAINYNPTQFVRHVDALCQYAPAAIESNTFGGQTCSPELILSDNMKNGDRNGKYSSYNKGIVTEVDILQGHMNRLLLDEYGNQSSGPVDGWFGVLTKRGVERLQNRLNQLLPAMTPLDIDGVVGSFTKKAINMSC